MRRADGNYNAPMSNQQFKPPPENHDVEITFDGKLLDVKPFTLDPGKERFDVFPSVPRTTRSTRGWLRTRRWPTNR